MALRKESICTSIEKRNQLAIENIHLVKKIANKYRRSRVPFEDLVNSGFIGLLRGIELFDESRGLKLSTYVYPHIISSVRRCIQDHRNLIALPRYITELGETLNQRVKQEHIEAAQRAREARRHSWDDLAISGNRGELIPDFPNVPGYRDERLDVDDRDHIASLFGRLTRTEARILWLRFGLGDGREREWKEVARDLGIDGKDNQVRARYSYLMRKLQHENGSTRHG